MLFLKKPDDFSPLHDMAMCIIDCNDEILVLQRHPDKFKGGMWDIPGGKIAQNESVNDALSREILEETGLNLSKKSLMFLTDTYVRYPEFDFICRIYFSKLTSKPKVIINQTEHIDYKWVKFSNIKEVDFVPDEIERINLYLESKSRPRIP